MENIEKDRGTVITEPSEGVKNNGSDNKDCELIMRIGDVLCKRYMVLSLLGKGVYGQVVRCWDQKTRRYVAVKVIKNHPDFHCQAKMEIEILNELQEVFNLESKRIVSLLHETIHKKHLVLVFELLGVSLYDVLQKVEFEGIDIRHVSAMGHQALQCLKALWEQNIIHCDMKPENVLIVPCEKDGCNEVSIKIIDFGSATFEHMTASFYVQSRFYRSPEVLLGIEYDTQVDMWSIACVLAEMYLGLPLFAGSSVYDQVAKIVLVLGTPSEKIIESGKLSMDYFDQHLVLSGGRGKQQESRYELKSFESWAMHSGKETRPIRFIFENTTINDIIMTKPDNDRLRRDLDHFPKLEKLHIDDLTERKKAFVDFLRGILVWDKNLRWTPEQALDHPFITGEKFTEPFRPKNFNPQRNYVPPKSKAIAGNKPKVSNPISTTMKPKRRNVMTIQTKGHRHPMKKAPRLAMEPTFPMPRNSWYNKPQLGQSPGYGYQEYQDPSFYFGSMGMSMNSVGDNSYPMVNNSYTDFGAYQSPPSHQYHNSSSNNVYPPGGGYGTYQSQKKPPTPKPFYPQQQQVQQVQQPRMPVQQAYSMSYNNRGNHMYSGNNSGYVVQPAPVPQHNTNHNYAGININLNHHHHHNQGGSAMPMGMGVSNSYGNSAVNMSENMFSFSRGNEDWSGYHHHSSNNISSNGGNNYQEHGNNNNNNTGYVMNQQRKAIFDKIVRQNKKTNQNGGGGGSRRGGGGGHGGGNNKRNHWKKSRGSRERGPHNKHKRHQSSDFNNVHFFSPQVGKMKQYNIKNKYKGRGKMMNTFDKKQKRKSLNGNMAGYASRMFKHQNETYNPFYQKK